MYTPRSAEELGPLPQLIAKNGIALAPNIYSEAELAALNAVMDPFFARKANEHRSYVWPDDMLELGILEKILSPRMQDFLYSLMPDPVIYHLLSSEIAGRSDKSHVFAEAPGGWHRDPDCKYFEEDPTHVSIFVYLTDVGPGDGAFEILPRRPAAGLVPGSPKVTMLGARGVSFAWHRSFYHRASPNIGERRRRIIKISIQRNAFISAHLGQSYFRRTLAETPRGDPRLDMLLGRYQGKAAPTLGPVHAVTGEPPAITGVLEAASGVSSPSRNQDYVARDPSELAPLAFVLGQDGVVAVKDVYSVNELAVLNAALNTPLAAARSQPRAYLWADELLDLGILEKLLSPAMVDVLYSIMPDPVIYHLLVSEIAGGNDKSHIFAEQPGGWHRDPDSFHFKGDPTDVSLFVYLSDVSAEDGALEVCPRDPAAPLAASDLVISVQGSAGATVAWCRGFYYRERPNAGPRRRRVVKLSIRRNPLGSVHLRDPRYRRSVAWAGKDPRLAQLFGHNLGKDAPALAPGRNVRPRRLFPTGTIAATTDLIK